MSGLIARAPGAAYANFGRGKFTLGLPNFGCMYAGYLLGTDYYVGTLHTPSWDLTRRNRDLIVTGEIGAKTIVGPTNYADTPFTGNDLASRTGRATVIAIVNTAPGVSTYPVSNRVSGSSGVQWMGFRQFSGSFAAEASQRLNADEQQSRESVNDTTRSGFEMLAGTYRPGGVQLWRSMAGGGLRRRPEDTAPVLASIGGPLAFRIGRSRSTGDGATSIPGAFFFDDLLTNEQIAAFLAAVTKLFAQYGLTVAQ